MLRGATASPPPAKRPIALLAVNWNLYRAALQVVTPLLPESAQRFVSEPVPPAGSSARG